MELDETMIASREAGERHRYGRQRMEVKVRVLFRGTEGVGRTQRKKTIQRSVYARISEAETFGETVLHPLSEGRTSKLGASALPRGWGKLDQQRLARTVSWELVYA